VLPARINLVTPGVADVAQSRAFYERLGFAASGFESSKVAFFDMNGTVPGLYGREALADDAGITDGGVSEDGSRFHGVSLAISLASKSEVDDAIVFAQTAMGESCRRRGTCCGAAIRDTLPIRMVISARSRTIG